MLRRKTTPSGLIVLCVLLALAVFFTDLVTPLGVASGVPYVGVVFVSLWLPYSGATFVAALACSVLTVLGFFWSPPGGPLWLVLANRVLALLAIWIVAALSWLRQRSETTLGEREALLRSIIDTAVDGMITIDERGLMQSFNPAAERLFGYTAAEVLGRNVALLMPTPYRQEHDQYITRYLRTGERKIIGIGREVVAQHKDGTVFPVELAVSEIRLYDRRLFTGIVHDITARKQAEDALREAHDALEQRVHERTAELTAANEEVRRFAYIVSHDLRAPLINLKGFVGELRRACTTIQTALDLALPHLDDQTGTDITRAFQSDVPEALGFIDTSVTRMDHLIGAILRLSRLGRSELRREPLDMTTLVYDTLQTLQHQITQRQVSVTVGSLPELYADRTAMEQIMGNLLSNAVAYLEPGRPGTIHVTAESRQGEVAVWVRDNGRGIDKEDIPKIFEPFRRVGKQDVPGEGMGLAYVRALVRRHGGDIWCESTLGVGTTFTLTIPSQAGQGDGHA
jgi:PAS domain S-box-containing protein